MPSKVNRKRSLTLEQFHEVEYYSVLKHLCTKIYFLALCITDIVGVTAQMLPSASTKY